MSYDHPLVGLDTESSGHPGDTASISLPGPHDNRSLVSSIGVSNAISDDSAPRLHDDVEVEKWEVSVYMISPSSAVGPEVGGRLSTAHHSGPIVDSV